MREQAIVLADRIIELVGEPYDIDGRKVVVGVSIGIALAPHDGSAPDELMKKADLALYRVKTDGRNGYALFDAGLARAADERHRLEVDLRARVWSDRSSNSTTSRWWRLPRAASVPWKRWCDGGTRRSVSSRRTASSRSPRIPASSIPSATGSCRRRAPKPRHGPATPSSPSTSPRSSSGRPVCSTSSCARWSIPACRPSVWKSRSPNGSCSRTDGDHLSTLRQLQNLGVSIALDDFGTGYSSLGYLKRFRFDKIKIDRSFTSGILEQAECAAIVCAVVGMGRALDIVTVAEGVETEQQLLALRAAGLDQVQGWLIGRPKPAHELRFDETMTAAVSA